MGSLVFEFEVGKGLGRRLDEAGRAVARIGDATQRRDLETDVRYAGTLLVQLQGAEKEIRRAPDVGAFAAATEAYVHKLERAEAAVSTVCARAGTAGVPAAQ